MTAEDGQQDAMSLSLKDGGEATGNLQKPEIEGSRFAPGFSRKERALLYLNFSPLRQRLAFQASEL